MIEELTYRITTHFGEIDRVHTLPHSGIDYATPLHTLAQSLSDGVVGKITNDPILGENVRITSEGGKEWVYGHLSQVDVSYGQHVKLGDRLGLTGGQPGTWGAGHSTGPHLHISLLDKGHIIDPTPFVSDPSFLDKVKNFMLTPPHIQTPGEIFMSGLSSISQSLYDSFVHVILPLSHSITLVGGALLIVLSVGGYKQGLNKLGILIVLDMTIQTVFST